MSGNRTKAGKERKVSSTAFKPGQSGNPNGRPKIPEEFKDIAKKHSIEALNKIIEIMKNPNAEYRDQMKACDIIMDRAWGKATQGMELSGPDGNPIEMNLSAKERQARIDELISKRGS